MSKDYQIIPPPYSAMLRRLMDSTPGVTAMLGMTPLQSYPLAYHGMPAMKSEDPRTKRRNKAQRLARKARRQGEKR